MTPMVLVFNRRNQESHVTSRIMKITQKVVLSSYYLHYLLKTYLFLQILPHSFTSSSDYCLDRFFRATRFLF